MMKYIKLLILVFLIGVISYDTYYNLNNPYIKNGKGILLIFTTIFFTRKFLSKKIELNEDTKSI
jgi:hypothetical protein